MNIGSSTDGMMMRQMMHQQVQQLRQDADVDGSSGLNIDEFSSLRTEVSELTGRTPQNENVEEVFATIDADGSGELSEDELKSFHEQKMSERGGMGGRPPGGMMSADMTSLFLEMQEEDSSETTVEDLFTTTAETSNDDGSLLDALFGEEEDEAA